MADDNRPIKYLSTTEVSEYLGLKPGVARQYKLPEPDAIIGRVKGWLPETIDKWNAERPGRGNWGKNKA